MDFLISILEFSLALSSPVIGFYYLSYFILRFIKIHNIYLTVIIFNIYLNLEHIHSKSTSIQILF